MGPFVSGDCEPNNRELVAFDVVDTHSIAVCVLYFGKNNSEGEFDIEYKIYAQNISNLNHILCEILLKLIIYILCGSLGGVQALRIQTIMYFCHILVQKQKLV